MRDKRWIGVFLREQGRLWGAALKICKMAFGAMHRVHSLDGGRSFYQGLCSIRLREGHTTRLRNNCITVAEEKLHIINAC
jgi:hypothetical protein